MPIDGCKMAKELLNGFIEFWKIAIIILPDGTEIGLWVIPVIVVLIVGMFGGYRYIKRLKHNLD